MVVRRSPWLLFVPALAVAAALATRAADAADCNSNGVEDAIDLMHGTSEDCNGDTIPDECQRDEPALVVVERRELPTVVGGGDAAVGDLDGNGTLDVVVVSWLMSTLRVFPNASLEDAFDVDLPWLAAKVVAADLDGDSRADVVLTGSRSFETGALVLWSGPDGRPEASGELPVSARNVHPRGVVAADFDGDGVADLAISRSTSEGLVHIVRSAGARRFESWVLAVAPFPRALAAGDFDGDGDVDLAVGSSAGLHVALNAGDGLFDRVRELARSSQPDPLLPGDIDGDGRPELVISRGAYWDVVALDAFGMLRELGSLSVPRFSDALLADLDGNGRLELVQGALESNDLDPSHLESHEIAPDLSLRRRGEIVIPIRSNSYVAADLDRDGDLDLAMSGSGCGAAAVLLDRAVPADCDADGLFDACDVDRDDDGTPDECAIRDGLAADCDRSGVPDAWEERLRFGASEVIPAAAFPLETATADFTGDGHGDVVLLYDSWQREPRSTLVMLRGRPDGSYSPPADLPIRGLLFGPILKADVDGDGDIDLVVRTDGNASDVVDNDAAILLNDGRGGFATTLVDLDSSVRALADLDRDGRLDMITNTMFLRGDGRGGFARVVTFQDAWWRVAAVDFDGDGAPELAGLTETGAPLITRNAGGAFEVLLRVEVEREAISATPFDIDGDGDRDFVVSEESMLRRFVNDGTGRFVELPALSDSLPEVVNFRAADIDGDGADELVGFVWEEDDEPEFSTLAVYAATPDAGLEVRQALTFGGICGTAEIADADADGDLDLLCVNYALGGVSLMRNDGRGRLDAAPVVPLRGALAAADFDGDGTVEVVVAQERFGQFETVAIAKVRAGTRDDFFVSHEFAVSDRVTDVVAADLDRDGDADLALTHPDRVELWHNDGRGAFERGALHPIGERPIAVVAGDWNRDGIVDLATANGSPQSPGSFTVLLRDGAGRFDVRNRFAGLTPSGLAAADIDGDGSIDLVLHGVGEIGIALNDGSGGFGAPSVLDLLSEVEPRGLSDLVVDDFDGDGDADLVGLTGQGAPTRVFVLANDGLGAFAAPVEPVPCALTVDVFKLAVADLDGDGDRDLAFASASSAVSVLERADGGFLPRRVFGVGAVDADLITADMDGDGALDIVTSGFSNAGPITTLLLNGTRPVVCAEPGDFLRGDVDDGGDRDIGDAVALLRFLFSGGAAPPCREAADANDDGRLNIADPVAILRQLFIDPTPLPEPFAACGPDPSPDALGCERSRCDRP